MTDMIFEKYITPVKQYFINLQNDICSQLQAEDGRGEFVIDNWTSKLGQGSTRVLTNGNVIEKGGVNFSFVKGNKLPVAATEKRPELAGHPFYAMGVSLVIHPNNPFVPTSHANVRFLLVDIPDQEPVWWFGGGFDLTPYYGFTEDCIYWHQTAKNACEPFNQLLKSSAYKNQSQSNTHQTNPEDYSINLHNKSKTDNTNNSIYQRFKKQCDDYFFIKHRNEHRGIGGLFFDDFNELGFNKSFELTQSVGNAYIQAYRPIVAKRKGTPFNADHKKFQLLRRGRYVEFNLVYDRGTKFGLELGGRTESILMSLPAEVNWDYGYQPAAGSQEAQLTEKFLTAQDWV